MTNQEPYQSTVEEAVSALRKYWRLLDAIDRDIEKQRTSVDLARERANVAYQKLIASALYRRHRQRVATREQKQERLDQLLQSRDRIIKNCEVTDEQLVLYRKLMARQRRHDRMIEGDS